jgi:hypothetical protein
MWQVNPRNRFFLLQAMAILNFDGKQDATGGTGRDI